MPFLFFTKRFLITKRFKNQISELGVYPLKSLQ